ncbi:hypothetical protein [Vibrio porteresiae]|uniref:Esterase n=1 Tax=Vibrio porteresiae DSM 19223 TaxID=1123496 RepID=A0ABZ0QE54_9VIBR|nr:hypothetical protein [Vibrio porteresiae]WPC74286.1 hypothetical protein R8Z52_03205 [Vibrio porteresiae DSM 19223]
MEDKWYKNNIQSVLGENVVFLPAPIPSKGLIIFFSAMNSDKEFDRINWFRDIDSRCGFSFLFLNDSNYTYYLGNDYKPLFHTYEKIINYFKEMENVGGNVFAVGSSMGGYAAIYYAFRMGLKGAIVGVPQTREKYARMHTQMNWTKAIKSTGTQWIDMDVLLRQPHIELPNLYLEYGNYPSDKFSAEKLIDIYKDRAGLIISRKAKGCEHSYFMSPKIIMSSVDFFMNEDFNKHYR